MKDNATSPRASLEHLWSDILDVIRHAINERTYNTWFAPTKAIDMDDRFIKVQVPNRFFCEWIENHYAKLLSDAIMQVLGDSKRIRFIVESNGNGQVSPYGKKDWAGISSAQSGPQHNHQSQQNNQYSTRINERYNFENFIVGDSNNFAVAAAQAVGKSPGRNNYNPLIIYGRTGLGKTHLIQAIGNLAISNNPATRVHYASSETFTSHFINAIQQNKVADFSAFYRSCDILLLDDIQFFSNKGKTQEEFFHTFNDLHQNGKQIVLTSDRPINELTDLEERLVSRFKWGLVVDIQPPEFETRLAILSKKCAESELDIPADVLDYLAVNLIDNVRELEGALTKIMAQVTFTTAEPTIDLARQIVSEIAHPDKKMLTIDTIMEHCSKVFGVSVDQIRAKSRKKDIVLARQVAMYLAKKLTHHSLVSIGLHFGGRDHATVIHGIDKIESRLKTDNAFRSKLENMVRHLEYNR